MLKQLFLNDKFILSLILINAIVIFFSGFSFSSHHQFLFATIDHTITILFSIEIITKLRSYKKTFFHSKWNIFDLTLVILSIPALFSIFAHIDTSSYSFFLVFRVMRVFKSFRFLKFIPGIDHLFKGIQRAMKASVIILLSFIVYIFIIGIFSFHLFNNSAPEYYGDPLLSLYSTFKIFTVEGWFEIPEHIVKNYSRSTTFFTHLYFIFILLSGGIIGLSIVNSIFVDAMVSDNTDELEKKVDELDRKINLLLKKKQN